MQPGPALHFDHVTVAFGSVVALRDISLDLVGPTSVALVGPNGSGKTTLLRLAAGLVSPSEGVADMTGPAAFVTQQHAHRPWMPLTAREIVEMGRYGDRGLMRRLRRADHDAIAEAVDRSEVADILGRQFGDLSGGQQQRVLVARALTQQSSMLLLDEPITGLDLASQERILEIVDDEVARGTLVLLSTHHLDEAHRCDRAMLLDTRVIADGPPQEVLVAENLREAYGSRVITADAGKALLLDDHGHDHP